MQSLGISIDCRSAFVASGLCGVGVGVGVGVGIGVAEGVTEADADTEEEDPDADAGTVEADDVTCVDESFDEPHAVNT